MSSEVANKKKRTPAKVFRGCFVLILGAFTCAFALFVVGKIVGDTAKSVSVSSRATEIAKPTAVPLVISGGSLQKSRLFHLNGGNYTVEWSATNNDLVGCNNILILEKPTNQLMLEPIVNNIISTNGNGSTNIYNISSDDYYINAMGSCSWSVTIRPYK